jgi:hypothetical protein
MEKCLDWIQVADRLPDDQQQILFFVDTIKTTNEHDRFLKNLLGSHIQFVGCGYAHIEECESGPFLSYISTYKNDGRPIHNATDDFVTHWMPLPAAPILLEALAVFKAAEGE